MIFKNKLNIDNIPISDIVKIKQKEEILQSGQFPDYLFFYELADKGYPSLTIGTIGNPNKLKIPICSEMFKKITDFDGFDKLVLKDTLKQQLNCLNK